LLGLFRRDLRHHGIGGFDQLLARGHRLLH
jgi:hypothetical protein